MYFHFSSHCNQRFVKRLSSYKSTSFQTVEYANGRMRRSGPQARSRLTASAPGLQARRSSTGTTNRIIKPQQSESSSAALEVTSPCLPVQSTADSDPLLLQAEMAAALGPIMYAVNSNLCIESNGNDHKEAEAPTQALQEILQNFEPHSSSLKLLPLVYMPYTPSPFAEMAVQKVYNLQLSGPEATMDEIAGLKRVSEAVAQYEDPFSALQPTPLVSVKQLASSSKLAPCTRAIVEAVQDSSRGSVCRKNSTQPLTIVLRFPTEPSTAPQTWQDCADCTIVIKVTSKRRSNDCKKVQDSMRMQGPSTSTASFLKSAQVAQPGKSHVQRMQELLLARFAGTC